MDKRALFLFPILTLVLGQVSGGLSFALFPFDPSTSAYLAPAFYPPNWLFIAVWIILYPSLGMSFALVWRERSRVATNGATAMFIVLLFQTMLFVPIMNISKGSPAIMTLLDTNATLTTFLYVWIVSRISQSAYLWMIPLMIWMPVTTAIKIAMWSIN